MKVLKYLVFLAVFLAFPDVSSAAYHFIRGGATGANSGTDWNNAWTSMPSTFVRGDIYYVADGTYPGFTISTPASGSQYVTIKKATLSDHGTDTGWQSAYGDGVAKFTGAVNFKTSYVVFDGQVGGGPGQWTTGHGFEVNANWGTSTNGRLLNVMVDFQTSISNIKISHVNAHPTAIGSNWSGFGVGVYCINVSNLTVDHSYIHDLYGPPFLWVSVSNANIAYNRLERNFSDSKGHSEGISFRGASNYNIIKHNQFVDVHGTGHIVGVEGGSATGWEVYGNVAWHTPGDTKTQQGFIWVLNDSSNSNKAYDWKIHNNTMYKIKGYYSGINIMVGSGNVAYNNIWYIQGAAAINFQNVSHNFNWFDDNSHGETNAQVSSASPFVDPASENFRLKAQTLSGYQLGSGYNTDMFGATRGVDGTWDRGAIEYSLGSPVVKIPVPPSGFTIN